MITFKDAVKDAVAIYTAANKKFSAKEVVQDLRDGVNLGEIDLSDRPRQDVDGKWTFKIDYTEVKDEIRSLFDANEISGYRTSFDKGVAGVYRVYVPINTGAVVTGNTLTNTNGVQAIINPTSVMKNVTISGNLLPNYPEIIKDYVAKHGPTRAKRIQSRMKRTPLTCQEIVNCANTAGLKVQTTTGFTSQAIISY